MTQGNTQMAQGAFASLRYRKSRDRAIELILLVAGLVAVFTTVAIVFILFDLETVFLFIWALGAQPVTGFMLFTFFLFTFLLIVILLYVYKARLLEGVTE